MLICATIAYRTPHRAPEAITPSAGYLKKVRGAARTAFAFAVRLTRTFIVGLAVGFALIRRFPGCAHRLPRESPAMQPMVARGPCLG